jgi:PAS domain S-box-containing protein
MDMKLKRIGPHWEKCLGWEEKELLNQSIMTFVKNEDKDGTLSFFDTLATEGLVIGYESRLLCKDGTYRWFAWNAQVVRENNKKLIVATGRDITRNKEIEAKNRDLEHAYQIETLKMEFFANISHEFRTPLNIILSALQLIQHSIYKAKCSSLAETG